MKTTLMKFNKTSIIFKNLPVKANFLSVCNFSICSQRKSEFNEDVSLETAYQDIVTRGGKITSFKRVAVLQPWIKWGPRKRTLTTKDNVLDEACALISTLPSISIAYKEAVSLAYVTPFVFTSGTLERLKETVRKHACDCIFISKNTLSPSIVGMLEEEFGMKIFDRYMVVLEIFKHHATASEARLQISLAEMWYARRYVLNEDEKLRFHAYRAEVRKALKEIEHRRSIIRQNRLNSFVNSIAVVGYTNCGKTSLIKILSGDERLKGENRLFATLHVTHHYTPLPCGLNVTAIDTVGFIQDIPLKLIAAFQSTLMDAVNADVIVYMRDLSHPDFVSQDITVRRTLQNIGIPWNKPMVVVNNKCDLLTEEEAQSRIKLYHASDALNVSCKEGGGLEQLLYTIESKVLKATGRKRLRIRLPVDSPKIKWLEENMGVTSVKADENDEQFVIMEVVMNENELGYFKKHCK